MQIHTPDGALINVNKAWEALWSLPAEAVVEKFNILDDRQSQEIGIAEYFKRAAAGESLFFPDYEFDMKKSGFSGCKRWVRSRIYPLIDQRNCVEHVVVTCQDITACKQCEDRYNIIVDNANEAIMVIQDGIIKFFNQKALEIAGYEAHEDYASKPIVDFVHPDYRDMVLDRHYRRMQGESVPNFYQIQIIHKNGSYLWLQVNAIRFDWEDRPASLAFIFDITEQKKTENELQQYRQHLEELVEARTRELAEANRELQKEIAERHLAEKALRKSEERYRDLFENATDLIQVNSIAGGILFVNRAWRTAMGYTEQEAAALSFADIIPPDHYSRWQKALESVISNQKSNYLETVFVAKNGRQLEVEGTANCKYEDGKAVSFQLIVRDVTEKNKIEKELLKNQKLESMGLLAGGIAHDFNNLLTAILGNVTLAKKQMLPQEKNYLRLAQTEKATLRAKDLTQQLLTFSKGGAPLKETTAIAEIIADSCNFAVRGSNVKCAYTFATDLWPVDVDIGQFSQVVQNLAINAMQVMPRGGTITVQAKNIVLAARNTLSLQPGKYVELFIKDQGGGIPQKNLPMIFDPYFTTKPQGSGLGLAIAFSIIKKHDGSISVESEPGVGSTFFVYLPASEKTPPPVKKREEQLIMGSGRILVMDDEEVLRDVAAEMLIQAGYKAVLASDGDEALALYKKAKEEGVPFDAVILDLTIPGGMGGKTTIKKLLAFDPEIKAIVSSGYVNNPVMVHFKKHGFLHRLPKPYEAEELSRVLHKVLKG